VSIESHDPARRTAAASSPIAPQPPGRELWSTHEPDEARHGALTWSERIWVYNAFSLLPAYTGVVVAASLLAGGQPWRGGAPSLWQALSVVALLHIYNWILEMTVGGGRRAKAVLSRPLRAGRHVWATANGDRVRVYRLEREACHVPHLWPLCLGVRARIVGGREFAADEEAEAAFAYAVEVERTNRRHLAARAIADVINRPPRAHSRSRS
jgi:hypothetical protein